MANELGTEGNDSFFPPQGSGNYTVDGKGGQDTVFIPWPRANFQIGSPDINGVTTITSASGGGELLKLLNIEFVQFSNTRFVIPTAQILTGTAAANTLVGALANDTIVGNGGADTLTGSFGGDKFSYLTNTDSTTVAFDTITDFQTGDAIEFVGMANVRLFATQFTFHGTRAATIAAINSDANFNNSLVSFSDGVDGWLYVRGTGTGTNFDGSLVRLQGRTSLLAATDLIGESGTFTLPTLSIAATSASKVEGTGGATAFTFTVTRSGDTSASSTVQWSVVGAGTNVASAADFAGGVLPSASLNFLAGETSKLVTVSVVADSAPEANEGFTISLSNAVGALLGTSTASGLINNDDFGKTVNLQVYSWKSHTLLDAVSVQAGANLQLSNAIGAASFEQVTDATLSLTISRSTTVPELQAVNLQDAIAILKMIVGLDVNGSNKPLSPYQVIAADYDGNGSIGLNDAISVLKHVVGLSVAQPQWRFVNEIDSEILVHAGSNPTIPATLPTTVSLSLSNASSPIQIGVVGILVGDVDGSFTGAQGSTALANSYFDALLVTHGVPLSQFGIYP
jgi:Peptidase M10 serralysin C terminal